MADRDPFAPTTNGSTMAVTDSSGATNATIDGGSSTIVIYNVGPNEAFVSFGTTNQTVTTSAWQVSCPPGSTQTFSKSAATKVAAICATGQTATLRVMVGQGA